MGMRGHTVKKNFIQRSLSSKKFRYGGYATLLILAALAIVIALNVLVDQIPWKADMTQNKLFSLSEQSVKILKELKSDVSITMLAKVGQENTIVTETLSKYARTSAHIKLATIDPERNPGWAKPYEKDGASLSDGGVVVAGAGGKRFKAIQYYDMYNWDTSDYTQEPQPSSLAIEQKVTTAILYVTAERNPALYALTGHNEEKLTDYAISSAMEDQNYETKDLSLLTSESVPADADVLAIFDPKVDLSSEDAGKIQAYLQQGGRLLVIKNVPNSPTSRMPNLEGVLAYYGVAMQPVLVVEGNPANVFLNNPLSFLPKQESHEILDPITKAKYTILLFASGAIESLPLKRKTLTVSPLLTTSMNSWGMPNYTTRDKSDKAKGDVEGPFTLAAAVVDQPSDPNAKDTRLVVVAGSAFLLQELTSRTPGNTDFFLNSLSWLRDKKDTISIQAKSLMTYRLRLNATQSWVLAGVTAILIPLLVLGAGLFVWLRRRHK
jgi:ABC-2 type transport system permease protein